MSASGCYACAAAMLVVTAGGCTRVVASLADDSKYQQVMALPEGLAVVHDPDRVRATPGGPSGSRYTYVYATRVRSTVGELKIKEFGAFVRLGGKWVFTTMYGRPFNSAEFAEWYSCPNARVTEGTTCSDESNFTGALAPMTSEGMWYYIGCARDGRCYRGAQIVHTLPEVLGATQ